MREDKLVEPLYEREPDNAPGPFYVIKGQCLICGLPPETAPTNITWGKETFRFMAETADACDCPTHCRVERQPETDEQVTEMIEAACGSCMEASRYCGTDPKILAKFKELAREELCDAIARSKA